MNRIILNIHSLIFIPTKLFSILFDYKQIYDPTGAYTQIRHYEQSKSRVCTHCMKLGHTKSQCRLKKTYPNPCCQTCGGEHDRIHGPSHDSAGLRIKCIHSKEYNKRCILCESTTPKTPKSKSQHPAHACPYHMKALLILSSAPKTKIISPSLISEESFPQHISSSSSASSSSSSAAAAAAAAAAASSLFNNNHSTHTIPWSIAVNRKQRQRVATATVLSSSSSSSSSAPPLSSSTSLPTRTSSRTSTNADSRASKSLSRQEQQQQQQQQQQPIIQQQRRQYNTSHTVTNNIRADHDLNQQQQYQQHQSKRDERIDRTLTSLLEKINSFDARINRIESNMHHIQPDRSYSPRSDRKRVKPTYLHSVIPSSSSPSSTSSSNCNISHVNKRLDMNINVSSDDDDIAHSFEHSEQDDEFEQ